MHSKVVSISFALVLVALAGCASDEAPQELNDEFIDPGQIQLASDRGAITGLLVDDRFRPIHLVEDASSEFQAEGFVLLQETGKQVRSNENGEFQFLNLEPGTYTLRTSSDRHEFVPQKISVTGGAFAEVNLVGQRKATSEEFILATEYAVFIPCSLDAIVLGLSHGYCFYDASGESYRAGFGIDLTEIPHNAVILEALTNQEQGYTMILRAPGDTSFGGEYYAEYEWIGNYGRTWMKMGEVNTEHDKRGNVQWNNNNSVDALLFYRGNFADELEGINDGSTTCTDAPVGLVNDRTCRPFSGLGQTMGLKAQFLQSVFLGETETDLDTYCVLC